MAFLQYLNFIEIKHFVDKFSLILIPVELRCSLVFGPIFVQKNPQKMSTIKIIQVSILPQEN